MSRADELLQIYGSKKKKEETKNRTRDLYNAYSSMFSEKETPHSTVSFTSRFTPMLPNASIIDSQLNAQANTQERKTQNYINSSPSVAVAPKSQTKYPAIEAEYQKKKTDIASGKQEQSVKDSYLAEAQLEREVKMLEERARNQAIIDKGIPGVTIPQKSAFNNGRTSAIQNTDSEELTKAKELLETKRAELKQIQESNKLNRALDDPELSQELETMFFNRADAQASEKYGKTLTAKGYDATEMLKQYTELKDKEAVEILKQLTLKHPDLSAEDFANEKYDEVKQLRWLGYTDSIELFDIYKRHISEETTEMISDKVSGFASENPALATLATGASFVTNLGKGAGSFAVSNPYVDRVRGTDENSLAFLPSVATETVRNTVSSNLTENQKKVYNLGTTIGDMIITQAAASVMGSSSVIGYSYLMASQAAGESARESVQKGYSPEHASVNAALTATIVTASSALGYDKIFKSTSATTFNSYVRNLLMNFMSEGAEETSEEVLTDIATSITNACYGKDGIITERAKQLMQDGMTEEEAVASAVIERISELSETFIVSGLAGGIISAATSLPEYSSSVVERQLNKKLKTPETDTQPLTTDVQNEPNLPSETEVETTPQTVPTAQQNAVNQPILTGTEQNTDYANEFDNLYDENVEEETETPSEEVETTVGEDGTVYYKFDDDTDFEALNDEIKTEYDTEERADLIEKTEPYSSGNAAVDAMVNPNGRLDRKVTVDEQAEKRLVDTAAKLFNRKVRFIDTYNGADGYYDKETGEIVIARDSDKKYVTVFGHEFLHSLEGTHGYDTLTTFLRHNSPYIKNKVEEFGNWEALKQNKITEYENALGVKLTSEEAEYEIYADAIADEFFSDYKTMESLATQNRSLFTKLKQWFYTNVIKITDQTRVYGNKAAARKTYALMLRAEKAANGVQSGKGKQYLIKQANFTQADIDESISRLSKMTSVYDIGAEKLQKTGKKPSELFEEFFNSLGNKVYSETFGDIDLPKSSVKSEIRHGITSEKLASIEAIPDVIQQGKVISYTEKSGTDVKRIIIAAPITIASNPYYMGVMLQRDSQSQRLYLHNVAIIEETAPFSQADLLTTGALENDDRLYITNILRNAINVKINAERNLSGKQYSAKSSTSFRYSAKKPEIISGLQADYGYSEASANNIYRAARTLKQNTGSKADIEQLTSAIVTSLENRRNGDIDSKNIERIAMMLAENAQAVNESYVSEYKPIIDYLKGTKISISEADISDLGDAFSYVKQRLFPTITLAKEGGTPVDTVFQELSAKFPNTFDAENITHPADQVKAIAGFIEEYRDNYYFKPYFEGDEAYTQLRDTVSELVNDKLIDSSTYLKRLTEMKNTYGEIKNGVPKSTNGKTRVRRTEASYYGSDAVQNSPERVERFTRDFVNGKHDYKVLRVGKEAMTYINNIKASENVVETVKNEYSDLRRKLTDKNYRIQPGDIVKAAALNPLLGDILTDDDYVEYTMLVADVATTAGQIVSSLKLISQFSGAQKLKAYHKKLDQINAKRAQNYQGEPDAYAIADENGQFKMPDDALSQGKSPANKMPKGFIELAVAKKQSKYPPIEIPARLEAELASAKTQEEIDKATDKINKYLAEQVHYSWFDKFGAWRYFSMLSNPKTAVRNTVGNIAMGTTARIKDVVAAAISALPSKYKEGSVQTTAVKTTKEARKAATRLLVESDNVFDLFSNQDKYTGRVNEFEQGEAKLNKIEQKIAERNPLLDTIFHKRSIQPTAMASTGRAIIDKPLGKLSDIQQKMLDDTLFKTLRAKSVLAQSITQAVKKGDIENLDDFLAVALNGNTDNIDNATKIHYTQLFDTISKQAAKEGDEATFREDNEFANALNKFQSGDSKFKRVLSIAVEAIIPFKKTPANIVKRGYEYSPVSLGINLVNGRVKLAKGEIDRNTYINEIAKGLTGTGIFALGALLSALGVLSVGDDDEEEKAERTMLGGQQYALNVGDGSYTIDFLSPSALPLFMGGKVYEGIESAFNGDDISATEFLFDILQGVAEPMFAQTMLSGIDGAFESISREAMYNDSEGASFIALASYCAENWVQQFVPSVLGAVARTIDDTARSYYKEKGKEETLLGDLMIGVKKKIPLAANTTPAKLDMWGQPISTGKAGERFLENFISPGYYQENTSDRATKALHTFATQNGIKYTDIIPKKPNNYFTLPNKTEITLTAEEYEKYAGIVGKARKEAVEKYLVRGEPVEIEYNYTVIKSSLKSGRKTEKRTFKGKIATATNRYGWSPTDSREGYIQFNDSGKAIGVTSASDEEFRKELFDELMTQVTDEAEAKAQEEIMKARNNK